LDQVEDEAIWRLFCFSSSPGGLWKEEEEQDRLSRLRSCARWFAGPDPGRAGQLTAGPGSGSPEPLKEREAGEHGRRNYKDTKP
jgi:hypothetical protein